jgi:hypothetical protein
MNTIEEPEAYSSIHDTQYASYTSFEETSTLTNVTSIATTILFIPNIPIPPIPQKNILLDYNKLTSILEHIPDSIQYIPRIHVSINKQHTFTDILPNLSSLHAYLTEHKDITHIHITIYYSLQLTAHSKLDTCISLQQSLGENPTLVNQFLEYNTRQPRHTRQHSHTTPNHTLLRRHGIQFTQPQQQTRLTDHFNFINLETLLTNVIQARQQ